MIKILEIFKILIVPFLHIQFLRTFLLNKTLQNCHIHANYNNWNEKTDFLEIFFAFISVRLEHLLNLIIYKRFWIRAKSLAAKPSFSWSKPYIIVFKDSKSQRLTKGFFLDAVKGFEMVSYVEFFLEAKTILCKSEYLFIARYMFSSF